MVYQQPDFLNKTIYDNKGWPMTQEPTIETHAGQNWTVMEIASILVSVAGIVYALLPWGVFQTRLDTVDLALMATPAFILVAALIAYAGTVLRKKTGGKPANRILAGTAGVLVWLSVIALIMPIMIRFVGLLFS